MAVATVTALFFSFFPAAMVFAFDTVEFFGTRFEAGMFSQAVAPTPVLSIPFGSDPHQVGGIDQDKNRISDGIPFAFCADPHGNFWLLDTINQSLKQFSAAGQLVRNVSLKRLNHPEPLIARDFFVAPTGEIRLMCPMIGKVFLLSPTGEAVGEIEGLHDAIAISGDPHGNLLVINPILDALQVFNDRAELVEEVRPAANLSEYTEGTGSPLGVRFDDHQVLLFRAETASPTFREIPIATLSLALPPEFKAYITGAKILGRDTAGNIYLEITAGDDQGVVFQQRIYRLSAAGEPAEFLEIKARPYLAPELPRQFSVTPQGTVLTYEVSTTHFTLAAYSFPETGK
jgi:hypothetical protein